jgi:hypothetical protein
VHLQQVCSSGFPGNFNQPPVRHHHWRAGTNKNFILMAQTLRLSESAEMELAALCELVFQYGTTLTGFGYLRRNGLKSVLSKPTKSEMIAACIHKCHIAIIQELQKNGDALANLSLSSPSADLPDPVRWHIDFHLNRSGSHGRQ